MAGATLWSTGHLRRSCFHSVHLHWTGFNSWTTRLWLYLWLSSGQQCVCLSSQHACAGCCHFAVNFSDNLRATRGLRVCFWILWWSLHNYIEYLSFEICGCAKENLRHWPAESGCLLLYRQRTTSVRYAAFIGEPSTFCTQRHCSTLTALIFTHYSLGFCTLY